jgi:hypothetical protein
MTDEYGAGDGSEGSGDLTEEEVLEQYRNGQLVPFEQTQTQPDRLEDYANSPMFGSSGGGMFERPTQSQAQLRYLLGTDEVPDHIKKHRLWSLVSRHLQLIRIESVDDLPYFRREIRNIIRTAMWGRDMRKVSYSDLIQIEFFAELLLRKSIDRGERILLATQITRSQVEDLGERSPSSGMQANQSSGGGLGGSLRKLFGGLFGG